MKPISRFGGAALRRGLRTPVRPRTSTNCIIPGVSVATTTNGFSVPPVTATRSFHSSIGLRSIMPDAENPAPRQSQQSDKPTVPTDIPTSEFHERADVFLEDLVERLEDAQEKSPDIEVEYSAGVLKVDLVSKGHSYVLNKQPPNKQIWLSSPISGPKRFDWVVSGESMNHKEGGGVGDWIYLRDGTSLTEIIRKELGVDVGVDDSAPS